MNIKNIVRYAALLIALLPSILSAENISVTTQTFNDSYAQASDGDVLLMDAGTYAKSIAFPTEKTITLKAQEGKAVIITFDVTGNNDTSEQGGGLIFENVTINRKSGYFISGDNFGNISRLAFRNTEITAVDRCLLRTNVVGNIIHSIEFENCLIHDCGNGGWNFLYPKHIVKRVSVKNSTLYNYLGESFFAPNQADNTNDLEFLFENNTVYKWSKASAYAICKTDNKYSTNSTYTFMNNIISEPGVSGQTPSVLKATGGILIAGKNLISNYGGYNRTETIEDWALADLGIESIGFPNPDEGDFTILSNSPLATAGSDGACIGDSRWIKKVTEPVQLVTTLSPEDAGSVTPVNLTLNKGDEATIVATADFGYRFLQWEKEDGTLISTENPYTFIMQEDLNAVAIFEQLTTYSLTLNKEGAGAKWGVVNLSPEPNDGKYIAGTIVAMTVEENPVTSFLQWEDGTSDKSRKVKLEQDENYTAAFDKIPFIVGWDLAISEPRGQRPADYAATTDNRGLLSLYNADGSTTNWGGSTRMFGGITYECARRYTDYALMNTPRYFQAKFSAKNYVNIKISSYLAADNACVHKVQKMQYSTDGTSFTDLATVELEGISTQWNAMEATLPVDVEGSDMVYIRWIGIPESGYIGNPAANDTEGLYLANIFVYADDSDINDKEAPILVSTSPKQNSNTASVNGKIVLSFNERVQAGEGEISFNGQVVKPIFGSNTATFEYNGLSYNTAYVFTVPAGVITDRSGNAFEGATLNFTTMNRPEPISRIFDAVVAKDNSGNYNSVQAAIDAAPENHAMPYLIFVKNGVYKEQVIVPSTKKNIHLIGQDKEKTNISLKINVQSQPQEDSKWYQNDTAAWKYSIHNPQSPTYAMEGSVVRVNADDFHSENISYINDWGVNAQNGPQALAMMTKGDRATFYNCMFRSFQDTWMTTDADACRHYVKDCYIEGAVDYVYGAGDCLFETCTLYNVRSGSVITAPEHKKGTKWGYVFDHCVVDGNEAANDGRTKLGRPWHNNPISVFLNTTMKINIAPEGWTDMGGIPALFAEYNSMDAEGNPIDLNSRKTFYVGADEGTEQGGSCQAVLTTEDAAKYTYENIVSGTDNWNPRTIIEPVSKPTKVKLKELKLSWEKVPYSICYIILCDEEVVGFTTDTFYDIKQDMKDSEYHIQAVNEYGSLGEMSDKAKDDAVSLEKSKAGSFQILQAEGGLELFNLPVNKNLQIYSLNGTLLYQSMITDSSCFIPFNRNGVYLIRVGEDVQKVVLCL